jgi:hypothetical protein
MGPYDIAVITGNKEVVTHQVYAGSEEDVVDGIRELYKDTPIISIIFAASDKC